MVDIESLLSSISDEDMAKIKGIADSLMDKGNSQSTETPKKQEMIPNLPFDADMMKKIMGDKLTAMHSGDPLC